MSLGREAGRNDRDLNLITKRLVERGAEDNICLVISSRRNVIDGLVDLMQCDRRRCGNVDQHARGTLNVDLKERRCDRNLRGCSGAVLTAGTADPHQSGASIAHDGAHVGEVKVDDAWHRNDVADTLHRLAKHVVSNTERIFHRGLAANDTQEPFIRDDDQCVNVLAELAGCSLSHCGAASPLKDERLRDDADREGADLFGDLRDDRCGARAGAATHTSGDKDKVRPFEGGAQILNIFLSGALANGRVAAGAEAARDPVANPYASWGMGLHQRLGIGVYGDEFHAKEFGANHAVDGIGSCAAHTDDANEREILRLRCHRLHALRTCCLDSAPPGDSPV